MLPCPAQSAGTTLSPVCRQQLTEEGFHVMGERHHRIETVRRLYVPGHIVYRDLRHCAHQCGRGYRGAPQRKSVPSLADRNYVNGPPNARPTAGLVLRYGTGCCFVFPRCRGPPRLSDFKNQTRRLSYGT